MRQEYGGIRLRMCLDIRRVSNPSIGRKQKQREYLIHCNFLEPTATVIKMLMQSVWELGGRYDLPFAR